MKKHTLLIICLFNVAAVAYMGYLVYGIYKRPTPEFVSKEVVKESPDPAQLMRAFLEATEPDVIMNAARQLPSPLPLPHGGIAVGKLLEATMGQAPEGVDPLLLGDILTQKIGWPESLTPLSIAELENQALTPGLSTLSRQQLASVVFDAALRITPDEANSLMEEKAAALEASGRLLDGIALSEPWLAAFRLRAQRLLSGVHPEVFSPEEVDALVMAAIMDADSPEPLLIEALSIPSANATPALIERLTLLASNGSSQQVRLMALQSLATVGDRASADTLQSFSESGDPDMARALRQAAASINARLAVTQSTGTGSAQ